MAFDPFGDRDTRGYLRNHVATNDADLLRRLETHALAANVLPALDSLAASGTVGYDQVLDTHRRLFSSVYPWAGQDRTALALYLAISKSGVSDLFAHPADVRRAAEYGLAMGHDPGKMRSNPGEVFGSPHTHIPSWTGTAARS